MNRRQTYLFLLEHHKVEMTDAFVRVQLHSFSERLFCHNLADVLINQ